MANIEHPDWQVPYKAPDWLCKWARFRYKKAASDTWTYTDDGDDFCDKRDRKWYVEERDAHVS